MIYVDNDAFFFESRDNLVCGVTLIFHHFYQFGIEIYIGTGNNPYNLIAYSFHLLIFHCPHSTTQKYHWLHSYFSREKSKREKESQTWWQRILWVKRNRNHQIEDRVCYLQQELQLIGELYIIIFSRRIWCQCTYHHSQYINGIFNVFLEGRQRQHPQQITRFSSHTHQPTSLEMRDLVATHIPYQQSQGLH